MTINVIDIEDEEEEEKKEKNLCASYSTQSC